MATRVPAPAPPEAAILHGFGWDDHPTPCGTILPSGGAGERVASSSMRRTAWPWLLALLGACG
ncbi:MAG: hypothetical protein KC619_12795, partial [Myxococcales bacterium]|nr:hypothetical protein [Myxococcales bacterium]